MLPTGILGDIVSMQKRGIFVYRENKSQNLCNPEFCTFRLGLDKVSERVNYDHVGVRACIYEDDDTGLEERVSKARRTLKFKYYLWFRNQKVWIEYPDL